MALDKGNVLTVIETLKSKISNLSIDNGQLVFTLDSLDIFWDTEGNRKKITDIIILITEEDKTNLLAPLSGKFYYVKENNSFYYYDSDWIKINDTGESSNNNFDFSNKVIYKDNSTSNLTYIEESENYTLKTQKINDNSWVETWNFSNGTNWTKTWEKNSEGKWTITSIQS